MAYFEDFKESVGSSNQKTFYCDSASDVSSLPTDESLVAPGASAVVITTGDVYMLNSQRQWTKFGG